MHTEGIIFTTLDPLGRKIKLKENTWTQHIKDRHPEVGYDIIKSNIEKPRFILPNIKPKEDGSNELIIDEKRQVYVDLIFVGDKMYAIKTVVEFENIESGTVVTNYILRKPNEIKMEGGVIYDSKQNQNTTGFINL
ncbi:hypothetical protein [Caloramator sp. Dgby_cultured_2]|uniref:hypothetical protein n=1 Tax=Caloramator sp. Dgby_cultured_2 TaxID=3029174 RepID=UPI00237D5053|nr:hypothetical protein [Caloramator sp. Dgby_cultured_2]WDU82249.1 hypothetical protein PWK10_11120 [Caloramator sp. Dgby_cultured_2]